jgi:hypothetical protein
VVDEAVDALERKVFFDGFNAGFARLREQPDEWRSVVAERDEEGTALADGTP